MEGIGKILKNARNEKGLSLTEVENTTKIRRKYIQAIEEENFEVMPGKIYLKGFVKTYAKFLNLEENEQINQFLEQKAQTPVEQPPVPEYNVEYSKKFNKKVFTLILGVFAIVLLWGIQTLYHSYIQENSVIKEIPSSNEDKLAVNTPKDIEKPVTSPEIKENTKPEKVILKVAIIDASNKKDECWMQVFIDGKLFFEGTLTENNSKVFAAEESIKITLGNSGVVKLVLGEKDFGIAGKIGQVVEKEFTISDMIE